MAQWQYQTISEDKLERIKEASNTLGKEGWEMVSCAVVPKGASHLALGNMDVYIHLYIAVFKRQASS